MWCDDGCSIVCVVCFYPAFVCFACQSSGGVNVVCVYVCVCVCGVCVCGVCVCGVCVCGVCVCGVCGVCV